MNDERKTKKQLLEELELERERSAQAEERSLALQEVSKRLAGAHDTDEILDLIVNEAARLLGAHAGFMRLLDGDVMVSSVATESGEAFRAEIAEPVRRRKDAVQALLGPPPGGTFVPGGMPAKTGRQKTLDSAPVIATIPRFEMPDLFIGGHLVLTEPNNGE